MTMLLFHGGEILAFFGGTLLGFGIFIGMITWALRGPSTTWGVPFVYVLIALVFSIPVVLTDSIFAIPMMFAFPWSILLVGISAELDRDLGLVWSIPAIIVNGLLFWAIAYY